jgi:Leucine-rich repeat (LRR) protein
MCSICDNQLSSEITELGCCQLVKSVPNGLVNLESLSCYNTFITKLPECPNLQWLNCSLTDIYHISVYPRLTELFCSNTNICELPHGLTNLEWLVCNNTYLSRLPEDLTSLYILDIASTDVLSIPKELTNLYTIDISNTLVTDIPKELVGLHSLTCFNTRIMKIPVEIKLGEIISNVKIIEYPHKVIGYKNHGNIIINNSVEVRETSFSKFQQWIRLRRRMPTLWKIAEYYSARKYSPDKVLSYISLD